MNSPIDVIVECPWAHAVKGEPWRALLYVPKAPRPFGGCGATPWAAIAEAMENHAAWERGRVVDLAPPSAPEPAASIAPAIEERAPKSKAKPKSKVKAAEPKSAETDPLQRAASAELPLLGGRR